MGVVVRRYIVTIIITFPYSTCISSFLAAASLLLCSLFKNKNKKAKCRYFTSRGAHVNCSIKAMLYTHSIGNQP